MEEKVLRKEGQVTIGSVFFIATVKDACAYNYLKWYLKALMPNEGLSELWAGTETDLTSLESI